jgi:hypothetical protein
LNISLDYRVSNDGFKALSKLPNLKKFTFHHAKGVVFSRCILLSTQFLPQLRVVGVDISSWVRPGVFTGTNRIHNSLVEHHQPVHLGLEEVLLNRRVQLHPTCRLPHLKSMHLIHPSSNLLSLLEPFPTVTELGFYDALTTRILELLPLVGCRLSSLIIEEPRPRFVPLSDILTLCPNLKSLQLFGCRLTPFGDEDVIPFKWPSQDLFRSLEYVQIEKRYDALPEGFIKKVIKNQI